VLCGLWLAHYFWLWAVRQIATGLTSWHNAHLPAGTSAEQLSDFAARVDGLQRRVYGWGRAILLLVAIYACTPVLLSVFPWSREIAQKVWPYVLMPAEQLVDGVVGFLPNLLILAVIAIVTRYSVKLARFLFGEVENQTILIPGFHAEWASPTAKLLSFVIIVFAVVLASPYLPGSGSPAFQGVSIFLGVLLSLGSTAAIANLVAGMALIYMRAFNVGDRVKIADTFGDVIEKTLLITRVRTVKNVEVTIPNSMVLANHMINFSGMTDQSGLILHTSVTIGYDVPWRRVHELLIAAAQTTDYVKTEPPPFVLQTALDDFTVAYELNVYTTEARRSLEILSELHQQIQDKFNEAAIEIMSPRFTAIRDGNMPALPEQYLPADGRPRGFKIMPTTGN
jgi:small-conductance mechanosensitive channel